MVYFLVFCLNKVIIFFILLNTSSLLKKKTTASLIYLFFSVAFSVTFDWLMYSRDSMCSMFNNIYIYCCFFC